MAAGGSFVHGMLTMEFPGRGKGLGFYYLSLLLFAVTLLGARAVEVIRENYGMSIAVNAAGLLIGAGGALSPVLAAVLHNASSVAVVANSSRLIRYRLN